MQDSLDLKLPDRITVSVLPLRNIIVFPYALTPLVIEGKESIALVEKAAVEDQKLIALFPEIPAKPEKPGEMPVTAESFELDGKKLPVVGVLCRIVKQIKFPDDTDRILVRGLCRIRKMEILKDGRWVTEKLQEPEPKDQLELDAMVRNAVRQFQEILSYSSNVPDELKIALLNIRENSRLVDLISDTVNISYAEKLEILTLPTLTERLQYLTILLNRELEIIKLGSEIQAQVHNTLGKSQREFYLREQLRTIRQELGEDTGNPDIVSIKQRLEKLKAPQEVIDTVKKETSRLETIPPSAGEYTIACNYIDWILSLPWDTYSEDHIDAAEARKILDRDHYGLKDVKERILEFLAVIQLKQDRKSPILCFVGPPGVGKTSLGKSIAEALGRKFVRISLGGVRDEAEIRGHRRTYLGALPGRIIQGLKKAGTSNPVFMLDEIDKLGNDYRGDPASALLEVLDPGQNSTFSDHFLELDYDLSSVMFIATANILDTIPPPLLDRMEIIALPGYTPYEKCRIARKYLVPRQIRENGLEKKGISFPMKSIDTVISRYTREAGVRSLERSIASVLRKIARKVVEGSFDPETDAEISVEDVRKYLGVPKYLSDEAEREPQIGVATGLAWTSTGGTILPVETIMMPGKGELKLTGSLGNVMKESAAAAFSFIRSKAAEFKISPEIFRKYDFHIHVPDGATPKDGPSAGITLATALFSLLTGRAVRNEFAMTGEITLRGHVTAIGGLKEKSIGALRAGIRHIILPLENRKDLEEIPDEVRKKITFHTVSTAEEAWKLAVISTKKKGKK